MKNRVKKITSVILCLVMLFSAFQTPALAAAYIRGSWCSVDITTNKKNYTTGEEIIITMTADNSGGNPIDLTVSFDYTSYIEVPEGGADEVVIENFQPNTETTKTIKALADRKTIAGGQSMQDLGDLFVGLVERFTYIVFALMLQDKDYRVVYIDGVPNVITFTVTTPYDEENQGITEGDYTVTFNLNYEGAENIVNKTTAENAIVYPEQPQRENFVFLGWYLESACENKYTSTDVLKEDLVLYASWLDLSDKTDTDGDGVIDALEDYIGTDKTKPDTDDDNLTDFEEYSIIATDPIDSDSDDNGILDGADDPDDDKLTNRQELDNSTSIYSSDTDADYLSDYDEIFTYFTDPTKSDTDDDGLWDADEIAYQMNPKDEDTLDDGVLDGDRTFTVTASSSYYEEGDAVKPELSIDLKGEQIETLSIEKVPESDMFLSDEIPGYIGNAYDFNVEGDFETATLSFEIDEELFEEEGFTPAIYHFNETTQTLEELDNQTIQGNKISAPITHFSKYIVVAKDKYERDLYTFEIDENDKDTSLHVAIVIDRTLLICSEYDGYGFLKDDYAYADSCIGNAVNQILQSLDENDKVTICYDKIHFPEFMGVYVDRNTMLESFLPAYNSTHQEYAEWFPGLCFDVEYSCYEIAMKQKDNQKDVIVVISSGYDTTVPENGSYAGNTTTCFNAFKQCDISVHTIGVGACAYNYEVPMGFGFEADECLSELSLQSGGTHREVGYNSLSAAVAEVAEEIEKDRIEYSQKVGDDTDGDGLSDKHEKAIANGKLKLGTGIKMEDFDKLSYKNPDSDGDGISDGDELKIDSQKLKNGERVYYCSMTSNPCMVDSDYDGFLDEITGKNTKDEENAEKDKNPLVWDVSDRDLAMFSAISYADDIHSIIGKDLSEVTGIAQTSVDPHLRRTAGYEELKGWKLTAVYDKGVMAGKYKKINKLFGFEWEGREVAIPDHLRICVFQKDNNAVIAYRGSSGELWEDDWTNNFIRYGVLRNDPGIPAVRASVVDIINNIPSNKQVYITGHSRGGMLAQNAAAEAVLQGYGPRITNLTYFNGIGAFIDVGGHDGTDDKVLGYNYENTILPLEEISPKIRRHAVIGDMVDPIGRHAVLKTTYLGVSAEAYSAEDLSNMVKKAHNLCNFTKVFMRERYDRARGYLPK